MIVETLFAGLDNTFSLQFMRGESSVNLIQLSSYKLELSNGRIFTDPDIFLEKDDGIVEVSIGPLLSEIDKGTHTCWVTTYDPVNTHGVRWPNFKLKVK
jgi:hypothetical protein